MPFSTWIVQHESSTSFLSFAGFSIIPQTLHIENERANLGISHMTVSKGAIHVIIAADSPYVADLCFHYTHISYSLFRDGGWLNTFGRTYMRTRRDGDVEVRSTSRNVLCPSSTGPFTFSSTNQDSGDIHESTSTSSTNAGKKTKAEKNETSLLCGGP